MRRIRRSALIDVARRLSTTLNVEDLLDEILSTSRNVMDCEVCSILLPVDGNAGDLVIRSTIHSEGAPPIKVPRGKGIAGEVFATHQTINIKDARSDTRHYQETEDGSGFVTRGLLTIPLLEGDQCIGVMQAINPNSSSQFDEEDQDLFEIFGSLISVTLIRIESNKTAVLKAQEKHELDLSREIQHSFLPDPQARFGSLELCAFYEPASEIGGDFYFWHELEPTDYILFGIGDVTGKGLPAALDMTRASTLIASTAQRCITVGFEQWFTELNEKLCHFMTAGRFIAINCILLNRTLRRAHICVAGIPSPKYSDGHTWQDVVAPTNPPLGISPTLKYQTIEVPLRATQHILFYSDGILEITQKDTGAAFEDEALDIALKNLHRSDDTAALLEQIIAAWRKFGGERPEHLDDSTLLIASDLSPSPPSTFSRSCTPDNLGETRAFFERWAQYCGFDDENIGVIVLGCDELMTNIIRHAYPCPEEAIAGEGPVTCHAHAEADALVFTFIHQGIGITNQEFTSCSTTPSPAAKVGGLGCNVIQQIFDSVNFENCDDHSKVTLKKHWC